MRRRILFLLLIFSAAALSASCQTVAGEKTKDCRYLSLPEAEKILGRRVELVTNSWTFTRESTRLDCAYRAIAEAGATKREINLFFMLEESLNESRAKQIYETIRQSNKNHDGIEQLNDLGSAEAYAHSDRQNFHFVMARKGKFTLRLKVNKASETTSLAELKAFARKVVEQI